MQKKATRISVTVYAILFLLLCVSFLGVYFYSIHFSHKLHTYSFTQEELSVPQDKLLLTLTVSKSWDDEQFHPQHAKGAQYDGVLINSSNLVFKDWSALITFTETPYIDSCWNGDFSVTNNTLLFVAQGDPATVAAGGTATFGAILYSDALMTMTECTISGYSIIEPRQMPVFWLLVVLSIVWVCAVIMYVVMDLRTRRFRDRQMLDSVIIRQSMSTFTGFIDAKDTYTKGHSVRVAEYASEIGRRMKMSEDEVNQLYYISLMHDCGKIGIPDAVLQKPGPLSDEEYQLIQSHTTMGNTILVNFTAIPGIRDGAHYHHERFDGKGYPSHLAGKDIPLCARIICVADSFDAMSSNRCYRRQLSEQHILDELVKNTGKQFDPDIVPYMEEMIKDGYVKKIQELYPNVTQQEKDALAAQSAPKAK